MTIGQIKSLFAILLTGVIAFSGATRELNVLQTQAAAGDITLVAGGPGVDGPALSKTLGLFRGIAVDASGSVYIAHGDREVIYRYDPGSGDLIRVAGLASFGYSGDGGPAVNAHLSNQVFDLALDSQGDLIIPDKTNHRIRKVDISTGIIDTIAGTSSGGFSGDGGLATSAQLAQPQGLFVDASDNIYFVDRGNRRVRRIDAATGIITTVAGDGNFSPIVDGGAATASAIGNPVDCAVDSSGNIYISDDSNHIIRKVDAGTGNISTIAGTAGSSGGSGDGGPATSALLNFPSNMDVDALDNLYIADASNARIRKIDTGGTITTVAGTGGAGFSGDGGLATSAQLSGPRGVDVDASGNIYIADTSNYRLRRVDNGTGNIDTIAGNSFRRFEGVGELATAVPIDPIQILRDGAGNIYFSDGQSYVIWKIDQTTGLLSIEAGTPLNSLPGSTGDGGLATSATLANARDIDFDEDENLFISESNGNRIRRVDASTGIIDTIAGVGGFGFSGDGGPATSAQLSFPSDILHDDGDKLYVSDVNNFRVRVIDESSGLIDTFAGDGGISIAGMDGPADQASISQPDAISYDSQGNIFIASLSRHYIFKVDIQTGIISIYAGSGTGGTPCIGTPNDGGPATNACISQPQHILHDAADNLYIVDAFRRLWKVDAETETAEILAGEAGQPPSLDPTQETLETVLFDGIQSMFFDEVGNLYYNTSDHIYRIEAVGEVAVAGGGGDRRRRDDDLGFSEETEEVSIPQESPEQETETEESLRSSAPQRISDEEEKIEKPPEPLSIRDKINHLEGLFAWMKHEGYQLTTYWERERAFYQQRFNNRKTLEQIATMLGLEALSRYRYPGRQEISNIAELLKTLALSYADCFGEELMWRMLRHDVLENDYWWAGYWHVLGDIIPKPYLPWDDAKEYNKLSMIEKIVKNFCHQRMLSK